MENLKKNKIEITALGLRNCIIAVFIGFVIKVIFDYFCAKDLVLNLSETTQLISNEHIVDSISFANQVGRLDLVSLILALLGLALGFGAVAGFLHIKENAERIAQIETTRWLEENAEKIAFKSADKAVKKAVKKVFENSELVQKAKRESKSKKIAKNEFQYYED